MTHSTPRTTLSTLTTVNRLIRTPCCGLWMKRATLKQGMSGKEPLLRCMLVIWSPLLWAPACVIYVESLKLVILYNINNTF